MFEAAPHLALILTLTGFVAGFVDAIAGGGGLLSVPALLLCGASPLQALATDKVQGMVGPGTGSFFMLALVMLTGLGVLQATAHTKMLNFASNVGSVLVFSLSGATWWGIGGAMALAQIAGATLGARLAVRIGAGLIKPLLVVTSTGMALRLLWQAYG